MAAHWGKGSAPAGGAAAGGSGVSASIGHDPITLWRFVPLQAQPRADVLQHSLQSLVALLRDDVPATAKRAVLACNPVLRAAFTLVALQVGIGGGTWTGIACTWRPSGGCIALPF